MFKIDTLKNGLTLITVPMPHLDSITTLVAVGAGSRYEVRENNGISHFLEHMFFKGSKKFPTAELISTMVDSIGAVNNAATSREYTYYWIKSAAKHLELSVDIISSMLKESLLLEDEISREKGVIIEESRMRKDSPRSYVWDLFEGMMYGDQPLGWDIVGPEKVIKSLEREDFIKYVDSLYAPENMVLAFAGKLPENIKELAEKHFGDLPKRAQHGFEKVKLEKQGKSQVAIHYKDTDQANLVLGIHSYDRHDDKRYPAIVLATILGAGMSSRLFIQVRERRGLAYNVGADHDSYVDTGIFAAYGGLKLEQVDEGLKVIKGELEKTVTEKVTDEELKKAKEMTRGHIALRSESTNFLAEHFATEFVLDHEIETFDHFLKMIDQVSAADVLEVAKELFKPENYNLQMIAPIKDTEKFEKILNS
jgi:predicted Zn-dependent peptidase